MPIQIDDSGPTPVIGTDAFQTLARGRFSETALKLHIQGGRKSYSPDVLASVEETWRLALEEAAVGERCLYNGKLFSLLQYQVRSGALNLLLGETDYKELLGTNLSLTQGADRIGGTVLSDGVAVCSILLTRDGFLVFGRRSRKVQNDRGRLHVCAGHPDPEKLLSIEEILQNQNPFFRAMKKEIMEEFHITEGKISQMTCLGLVRNRENKKPEVIFRTALKVTASQVQRLHASAKDSYEHDEIVTIPSEPAPLIDMLRNRGGEFTIPALAALTLYGVAEGFWTQPA
jgi:hypothetical protein